MTTTTAHKARMAAEEHPSLLTVAKVGWAANGVLYAIIGVIAVAIAWSTTNEGSASGQGEASPTGALQEVAERPLGEAVLWVLAIGLFLYAAWRVVSALLPGDTDGKALLERIGRVASAVIYAAVGFTALSMATSGSDGGGSGGSGGSGSSRIEEITRDVLDAPAGRWLVGIAGLGMIAIGAFQAHRGWSRSFLEEVDESSLAPDHRTWLERLGVAGFVARGASFALAGVFVLQAAIQYDASEARGLDGALRETAGTWWGTLLVTVVGAGLVVYGAFVFLSAPHRLLRPPSSG